MTRHRHRVRLGIICAMAMAAMTLAGAPQHASEISGTVITTSDPRAPLARVLVTISGASLKSRRTVISDEHGRFAFRDLPPGSFTIVAVRPPFVKMAFGAKRPGRPGTAIELAAGRRVLGLTIPLPRGAAIAGMIRHAGGEPAVGVTVTAASLEPNPGVVGSQAITDDRGVYRLFGLPPGRYVVTAGVTERAGAVLTQFSDAEMDAILARLQRRSAGVVPPSGAAVPQNVAGPGAARDLSTQLATYGYAPIHFPGTPDPDQADTVELAEGEERAGIDIGLRFVRTVAIDGRVSNSTGALPPGTQVTLTRLRQRANATGIGVSRTTRPADAAGVFQFAGVLPGRYRIAASVRASIGPDRMPSGVLWALVDVTIGDNDVSGLAMLLQPGLRLSGRLAFDSAAGAKPIDLTSVLLRLIDVNGPSTIAPMAPGRADGTFEINAITPGTYTLTSLLTESGWWLRSVMIDGRDMLDSPLEIGSAGDISGAVATFTDRRTELSGRLQTAANVAAPDYFIVVFSRDRAHWLPGSRRVLSTRPNTDGRYVFRDLPAGEYLLAALTDVELSDLSDTSFLERLIQGAAPVRLGDGEKKTQDLRLVR